MNLIEVAEANREQYNRFVAESPSGSFLQSWEWGQWQTALGREVYRFFIMADSSYVIGSVQLIKMPITRKKNKIINKIIKS